jgi:hypothetical protein
MATGPNEIIKLDLTTFVLLVLWYSSQLRLIVAAAPNQILKLEFTFSVNR